MDKISRSQDSRIVAAGIDAAKSSFTVCGVDFARRIALERTMNRARLLALFANVPPCTVGLEACSGGASARPGPYRLGAYGAHHRRQVRRAAPNLRQE
jgi:hypothetical protein